VSPSTSPLSANDIACLKAVLGQSWSDNTCATYGAGLLAFHIFCDKHSVPKSQHAPITLIILQAFISSMAGSFSHTTISNYVYGIQAWHVHHGIPWNVPLVDLHTLLNATCHLTPILSTRPHREPYTVATIIALQAHLDLSNLVDTAIFACLTTAFYGIARLGEVTTTTQRDFNTSLHITPSDVCTEQGPHGKNITVFCIPHTKTSLTGQDIYWAAQADLSDPYWAWINHLRINEPPTNAHMFMTKKQKGRTTTWTPLSRHTFLKCLTIVAQAAQLTPLQGHSICIGSTLEYLLRGLSLKTMKAKGQWASNAFTMYLHRHVQVMALHMQVHPELHQSFMHHMVQPFPEPPQCISKIVLSIYRYTRPYNSIYMLQCVPP